MLKLALTTYIAMYVRTRCCFVSYLPCTLHLTAVFTVSLELQGGNCSDQLTLICRHSGSDAFPLWIHNRTVESGDVLATAFPGAVYTVQTRTEHTATISGVGLDGIIIQCVYNRLGNIIKSNAVQYSFIPTSQSLHA